MRGTLYRRWTARRSSSPARPQGLGLAAADGFARLGAGVLPPERAVSADGNELTLATNVLGPFLLTNLLIPLLTASAPARVVIVSSGARYTHRGGRARDAPGLGGHAGGPPLAAALHRLTGPLLRSPEQGADTIVWLGAADEPGESSGGFWHDRRRRPTHRAPWTRETFEDREQLWRECERLTGWRAIAVPAPTHAHP